MGRVENVPMGNTSMRELIEMLPTVLSTYPSNINIFQVGSFDILWRKTGSEVLKKGIFLEKLSDCDCQLQNLFSSLHSNPGEGRQIFQLASSPKYLVDLSMFLQLDEVY